jgi:translation elongation factor P/translation initiation factor 5A
MRYSDLRSGKYALFDGHPVQIASNSRIAGRVAKISGMVDGVGI